MEQKITFVCCPKPFIPDFYDIQHNAIISWTKLKSVDKILICGNDEGVEQYAENLSQNIDRKSTEIVYIKHIKVSEFGTPLVDDLFRLGEEYADKYACYINADIILLSDFDNTFDAFCKHIKTNEVQQKLLLVGTRWDWRNPKSIDFEDVEWQKKAKEEATNDGVMHAPTGIDYFLFSKGTFPKMHPFALGKFWWDNWIVGNAFRRQDVITVDVSSTVFAIHQNSPWFSCGNVDNAFNNISSGTEYKRNHSYDPFGRNIATGTSYKSLKGSDGSIAFVNK